MNRAPNPSPPAADGRVVIGTGRHGILELDPTTMTVRKMLRTTDPEKAARSARQEFDRLARLAAAVADDPHLTCPQPIGVTPEAGVVEMSYCAGRPLDHLIADGTFAFDDHAAHIVDQIERVIVAYIETFGEPYYSLSTANMVYHPATSILGVLDFAGERRYADVEQWPLEVSLGCFVGRSIDRFVRPNRLLLRAERKRSERLLNAVLSRHDAFAAARWPIVRRVAMIVRDGLARPTRHRGAVHRLARSLWYGSFRVLFGLRLDGFMVRAALVRLFRSGASWSFASRRRIG